MGVFDRPSRPNEVDWATPPDLNLRDAARAVALAQEATKLAPREGAIWNTLGVALCRAGKWKDAIPALKKSMGLTLTESSPSAFPLQATRPDDDPMPTRCVPSRNVTCDVT